MDEKVDINGIKNKEELEAAYSKLVSQYEEVIKNAGPIAKKAIELGYKAQIAKINKKYDQIKKQIDDTKKDIGDIGKQGEAYEMGIAGDASSKKQEARQWQNAHEGRSSTVVNAVDRVKQGEISAKSVIAMGAIKLTTFGAKGARLFGAKGTADRIAESGNKYAQALFTKDSRISEFAENMAKSGFVKADQVRSTINRSKEILEAYGRAAVQTAKDIAEDVKDGVTTAATAAYVYGDDAVRATVAGAKKVGHAVKDGVDTVVTTAYVYGDDAAKAVKGAVKQKIADGKKYVKDTKEDLGKIGKQGEAYEMGIAGDASSKKQEARQWQNAHEGRSSTVVNAVDRVKQSEISAKSVIAMGAIKLTTFGAKGVRLFGAKGTAERIATSGNKYAEALFTKDSRISEFAENMAKSGFAKADQVRGTIDHSKETLEAYGRVGIDVAKKGALQVGKAALIPAAAIGAVGSLSLQAAEKGIHAVGEKAGEIKEDVGNYKELAVAKVQNVKSNVKTGFLSRVSGFLTKVKDSVDKSLETSENDKTQSNERLVAAKQKVDAQKEAQEQDEGPEL